MPLSDCKIFEIPRFFDERGSLSVVESSGLIPFDIRRVYYLYDIPAGQIRAAHGHRSLQQFMIALSGSFEVKLDDGFETHTYRLDRPDRGLYIAPGMWRDLNGFSGGSVCMVIASDHFNEADYLRKREDFLAFARR